MTVVNVILALWLLPAALLFARCMWKHTQDPSSRAALRRLPFRVPMTVWSVCVRWPLVMINSIRSAYNRYFRNPQ